MHALSFESFSFSYPGGPRVVGPVNWEVEQASFTLLVGSTGSGKTTLLRCVKHLIAPHGTSEGMVRVLGRDAKDLSVSDSASMVGYVAQSPDNQLVCDTVWHEMAFGLENLGLPQAEMRRRVAEVAHFFGIENWFQKGVNELSGGQRQLLNLASVLVMQPRVLLLDEPTAQLDPVAQRNFCHALFRLNRELGLTIVVATHAPEVMSAYATACVRLEDGRIEPESLESYRQRPLALPDTPRRDVSNAEAAIRLQDVYARYAKQDPFILHGADLVMAEGSIHALVGGNGSGKTTLLSLVAGVMTPVRGRVANALSGRQAFLPQNPKALFVCDTVREELEEWSSTCGYGKAEIERELEYAGLSAHVGNHPYDLSGGQQQLLAFAKLALTRPELLILDEPAKGLDPRAKLLLARRMVDLSCAGCTIVLATHDLGFAARVADSVSMLFDGQVTCTEPAHSFFRRNLFYRPMEDGFTRSWDMDEAEGL